LKWRKPAAPDQQDPTSQMANESRAVKWLANNSWRMTKSKARQNKLKLHENQKKIGGQQAPVYIQCLQQPDTPIKTRIPVVLGTR